MECRPIGLRQKLRMQRERMQCAGLWPVVLNVQNSYLFTKKKATDDQPPRCGCYRLWSHNPQKTRYGLLRYTSRRRYRRPGSWTSFSASPTATASEMGIPRWSQRIPMAAPFETPVGTSSRSIGWEKKRSSFPSAQGAVPSGNGPDFHGFLHRSPALYRAPPGRQEITSGTTFAGSP